MADPRASVKTVPRERLEGKTPRDAFALVGNIIAEFQASFRACYHHDRWISLSLSLSLSLSPSFSLMTLAATLVRGRSHESYIPSRMFIPRSVEEDTESFEISPFGLYY